MDTEHTVNQAHQDESERLSDQSYWSALYEAEQPHDLTESAAGGSLRRAHDRLWGSPNVFGSTYASYLIDKIILKPNLPSRRDWKVLEVGSAPGNVLVRFHEEFGYDAYGVEYTDTGVETNRRLFAHCGLDPRHVLKTDFFAHDFHKSYRGHFNVVYSCGFIEHFRDAKSVVRRHVNLLKDDGYLLIQIPNFRGVNYWLARFFQPEVIGIHNLDIMDADEFRDLFEGLPLQPLYCGYIGTFALGLQNRKLTSWKRYALSVGLVLSALLGLCLRVTVRTWHPESSWLSPYLLFVGRKHARPASTDSVRSGD